MLTTATALPDLRRRLSAAGFDEVRPDLAVFWSAWRAWITLPIEGMGAERGGDMLLFECSLSLRERDWVDRHSDYQPNFTVSFTRQFTHHGADGQHLGMEQLGADLIYEPLEAFRSITTLSSSARSGTADAFWGSPAARSHEWADRVEATRSYRTALGQVPRGFHAFQSAV